MSNTDSFESRPQPPPMIGSYKLSEPLGSGGMSSVFLATHEVTGHVVAVKVLPRYLAKNPTLLQRFLREAKSAESLEDPNIVAIYDHGSEAGRHYLVLEYVPGGDLHDRVRNRGPLGISESVDVIRQVARGLRHAAGRGLIHRDIKPANLLMTPEGNVKITDLGLALHIEEEDERVTRDGTTVGTVDYMAPEQARDSRATSIRSDIYSLGCTLYFLLCGQAPFAGGDVAEKLRSHALEPPPDIRGIRPEAPEVLARLVQKMMAKKADKRYADYDRLIEALDSVTAALTGGVSSAKPEPLYALIADDDDDDLPLLGADPSAPLYALIDEDDDEERFTLGPGRNVPGGSTGSTHAIPTGAEDFSFLEKRGETRPRDIDLSGLAGIDDDSPALPSARKTLPKPPSAVPLPLPAAAIGVRVEEPEAGPEDPYGLEDPETVEALESISSPPRSPSEILPWVLRGAILGVIAVILAFSWVLVEPYLESRGPVQAVDLDDDPSKKLNQGKEVPWAEPADVPTAIPAETPFLNELLVARKIPGVAEEAAPRAELPLVELRRVDVIRDRDHVGELRRALDTIGGTVEIADDGPFYEQDLRVSGANRVIRARPGYRPMVVLEPPRLDSVRTLPAVIELVDKTMLVEGVDFVINGADLGPRQRVFFLCKGSDLTLRDCTITVVGPLPHPFAVIQVGEPGALPTARVPKVRIERTVIRGAASQAVAITGAGEVTIARSALVAGGGPALAISGGPKDARRVEVFRSLIASTGPVVEVAGAVGTAPAVAPKITAVESTFARVEGKKDAPSAMIGLRDIPAGPARKSPVIEWSGDANTFVGLKEWIVASPPGLLAGLKATATDSDARSVEKPAPLPATAADPWADNLATLAAVATNMARPSPRLREKTLGAFAHAAVPTRPMASASRALQFDVGEPTNAHDLGRFLIENAGTAPGKVHVQVRGKARIAMTAAVMPPGVSLEVVVEPTPPGGTPLTLIPAEGIQADGLFSVRGAELSITGARISHDAQSPRLKGLVSVDQGNLSLDRCILTGPGDVETGGGNLVKFRTNGTRPFPYPDSNKTPGMPSCRISDSALITGGNALTLEIGRGQVDLNHCAIASGAVALNLIPENIRRDKFEADLRLNRCTIASEQTIAAISAWPGLPPGPDRPWVVASQGCVFLDPYDRGASPPTSVLLRSQPEGLARNVLMWESSGDVYDLAHFTAGGEAPPPASRADVQRQWAELWGASHVKAPSGPRLNGPGPAAKLLSGKLKLGEVTPADLALDPNYPKGRKTLDVGADLGKLDVAPR